MTNQSSQIYKDAVLAVVAEERKAVESGNIGEYLSLLTDDAVFMPPNIQAKSGDELHTWLGDFVTRFQVEWQSFVSTEILFADDIAYHGYKYSWRVVPRTGGEPAESSGKGVHLLRRQADGSWKIAREIWNSSPPDD